MDWCLSPNMETIQPECSPWHIKGFPTGFPRDFPNVSGWWYTYHSEKYECVSWDYDIPNLWKVIIHSCSSHHQPVVCFPIEKARYSHRPIPIPSHLQELINAFRFSGLAVRGQGPEPMGGTPGGLGWWFCLENSSGWLPTIVIHILFIMFNDDDCYMVNDG